MTNKLQNFTQVDNHRRRMGLNQKFKSAKIKKEKQPNFSTVETKLKHRKSWKFIVGILLIILVIIVAAIYARLQSECGGDKDKLKNNNYCKQFNDFQRSLRVLRSKFYFLWISFTRMFKRYFKLINSPET